MMQRGGQAARTGRKVISQEWGPPRGAPLESLGAGWAGGLAGWLGGPGGLRYVPGTYLGSSLPSLHCYPLATVLPPPPLCRSMTVQCPSAHEATLPKVQPSSRPKRAHSDVKLLGASPSLIGIEEQHEGTPTILSRALLTLAISRADSSCIMQHMALTSHGLHVISSSLQSLCSMAPRCWLLRSAQLSAASLLFGSEE